ncbi:hypothetical protein B0F90DRAFT_359072 [Multifurca ochricompacta]|uniref:PAS domain-containing protein n=1 Tax=Multifurca ochricompacta TaxID=376703 RepID=A0AAD4QME9_9AGAM|nr:hypothetical protein B0F90DRAFT_359072 [Multifurca ochricompacta]
MDSTSPCVSFIGIVDFTEHARWVFLTESVSELLGYEPHELVGSPSLDLVHPDEYRDVKNLHYTTISQDKAAVLAYLRLKHKDPYKGYILCAISRTVAWNVLVGSVSFASMGPKAMHNASTAQEVTIITPSAANFEFRRWGDPSPMPPSPIQGYDSPGSPSDTESVAESSASDSSTGSSTTTRDAPSPTSPRSSGGGSRTGPDGAISFDPLPKQSIRTALILDRFSTSCPIIYCSNDSFLSTTQIMGRPFFDFVTQRDEALVRSWIDAVKGWGVNERGQPSDGGFGFGKFHLFPRGRDSVERLEPEPPQPQTRHGRASARSSPAVSQHHTSRTSTVHSTTTPASSPVRSRHHRPPRSTAAAVKEEVVVDAIFSAHSDGLMVILRHASSTSGAHQATSPTSLSTAAAPASPSTP